MKNFKIMQRLFSLLVVLNSYGLMAQISFDPNNPNKRTQNLNQYTSVFICSPNNGTIIQNMHDDSEQLIWPNSDKFQYYDNGWVYLAEETPTTTMQPGRGYVLQLGGNGNYGTTRITNETFDFSGGAPNNGIVTGPNLTANQFNLLGNPYSNFLDLDIFLTSLNNRTKVKGPIMLWSHNTITSNANINPNDPTSTYTNSANDFALYNVLGGVASGRQISTSADNGTETGIQTPNGKICMGTGFGIYSIGSGNVVYDNTMRTSDSNIEIQSFRLINHELSQKDVSNKTNALVPSVRSRIWLNLERGTPPTSGINTNPLKQALVGYSPCYGLDCPTTSDSDRVFDAETVTADSNPSMDLYSFASGSTKHLAIQGRKDFVNSDSFKIGYKATAGTHTFTSTADGMFGTTPYYIYDANDGQYHTLPYTFTAPGGTEDNRFKIVFENLIAFTYPVNVCGSQLSDISNSVYAQNISGVNTYHFEVRTVSDTGPVFGEYTNPNSNYPYVFNLNIPGITYNTDYWVRVAIYQLNGVWQYGPVCKITTPASPPKSYLNASSCNSTLTGNWSWNSIQAQQINVVGIPATQYRFNATVNGLTYTYTAPISNPVTSVCNLHSFVGMPLTSNTTYSITVDVLWNNTWQIGNTSCNVTSPNSLPRLSSIDDLRFEVNAYPNPFNENFNIEIDSDSNEKIQTKIYDLLGRLIEQREFLISDTKTQDFGNKLNSGIYNIIVSQGENTKTIRVIKR